MEATVWGLGFPKIGCTFLGGPYSEDYSILGSILGRTYFGNHQQGFRMQIHIAEACFHAFSKKLTVRAARAVRIPNRNRYTHIASI